jgi:hypothetical protein
MQKVCTEEVERSEGGMYRGAFNEKHSTTETTCLFAPTTTATTQKHSQSRCKAKCRADNKKKKFISTQNKENRNERERERERTLRAKQTGLELTRFMLKSRFIQIGKQSLHDDGDNLLLL